MPLSKKIAKFNKYVTNKFFLLIAGWLAPWAIVHHTGRRSGKSYRTPVMTFPTESGFVFALTYGRDVDWVKNLLAADSGFLEYKRQKIPIHDIRIADYEEHKTLFPSWIQRSLNRIKLENCLLVEADTIKD